MITFQSAESSKKSPKNPACKEFPITAEPWHTEHIVPYGGVAAGRMLMRGLGLAGYIDDELSLLKQYHDYTESDHILHPALSILAGGDRLYSTDNLSNSSGILRLTGADSLPSSTAIGDNLYRFKREDIWKLQEIIRDCCGLVWSKKRGGKRKEAVCTIDTDSTLKPLYGNCFEGADFNHRGEFSYHPEYVSRAETGEILAVENRGGNAKSGSGVEKMLERVYPFLQKHFKQIIHRGDSKYGKKEIIEKDEEYGVTFYLGYESYQTLVQQAEEIPEAEWSDMPLQAALERKERKTDQKRAKQPRHRRRKVQQRGYKDLRTTGRQVSSLYYQPTWSEKAYRMIVIRSNRELHQGETFLYNKYEYYFIITNDTQGSPGHIAEHYYKRDDQENIFKQLKHETGALWMPSKTLLANWAWMSIHTLAWNMKSWMCQLGFKEGLRWSWNRFVKNIMMITGKVVKGSRQIKIRLNDSHNYMATLKRIINKFAALEFT
jgi:hypothetical protein